MSSTLILKAMQGPLCGTLASMLLYGVICMQVFYYVNNYASSDRHALKWLVSSDCSQISEAHSHRE
ncbi:hypothetical protein JVU11DRAFT_8269 [Chiua virens]|nr:hypothetical protein JVU11DRAFT_8269 [Chiua virens]